MKNLFISAAILALVASAVDAQQSRSRSNANSSSNSGVQFDANVAAGAQATGGRGGSARSTSQATGGVAYGGASSSTSQAAGGNSVAYGGQGGVGGQGGQGGVGRGGEAVAYIDNRRPGRTTSDSTVTYDGSYRLENVPQVTAPSMSSGHPCAWSPVSAGIGIVGAGASAGGQRIDDACMLGQMGLTREAVIMIAQRSRSACLALRATGQISPQSCGGAATASASASTRSAPRQPQAQAPKTPYTRCDYNPATNQLRVAPRSGFSQQQAIAACRQTIQPTRRAAAPVQRASARQQAPQRQVTQQQVRTLSSKGMPYERCSYDPATNQMRVAPRSGYSQQQAIDACKRTAGF